MLSVGWHYALTGVGVLALAAVLIALSASVGGLGWRGRCRGPRGGGAGKGGAGLVDAPMRASRPRPEDYRTGAEYRWRHKLWKREHGG